jgi:predicted branched-subunit amino acid permease
VGAYELLAGRRGELRRSAEARGREGTRDSTNKPDRFSVTLRNSWVAATPPALAIFVFGVIYGSVMRPVIGREATLLSSLLIFSGAVQFTLAGLLRAGAEAGALIAAALTLNLRNLLLGAVLRSHLDHGPARRAGLAWFLTDESTGLALTGGGEPARILLVTGVTFYLAWQAGTALGLVGASFGGVVALAQAVFPVLFIGLAALSCASRENAIRALAAAGLTLVVLALAPALSAIAAVGVTVLVSLPERHS